jgi:protein-S-isoprenylcysteine O-methyltransferase Ste14
MNDLIPTANTMNSQLYFVSPAARPRTMRSSRLRLRLTRLLAVSILTMFGAGAAYWTAEHPLVEKSLFVVGVVLAGFGAAGRAWATSYISGHKLKRLVTTGPYSICRNPLYFFSTMLGVGFGFCTETFTMPVVIGVALLVLYYFQIRREEKMLHDAFGAPYEAYLAAVPRFFPTLLRYTEPEEISISPRLFKSGLFGIAFLLMLIGVLEMLEGLHQSGVLPVYFRIY